MNWKQKLRNAGPASYHLVYELGFDKSFASLMIQTYNSSFKNESYTSYREKVIKYIESLSDVEILILTGGKTWHLEKGK